MNDPRKLKMYILILDDVPVGHAVNSAAHASLACYLKHSGEADMTYWLSLSFRKVCCMVTAKEFEHALNSADRHVVLTESALGGRVVAAAFCPRHEWPESFKFFRLYKAH